MTALNATKYLTLLALNPKARAAKGSVGERKPYVQPAPDWHFSEKPASAGVMRLLKIDIMRC